MARLSAVVDREEYEAYFKIILLGDSFVGKTSICNTAVGRLGYSTLGTIGVDLCKIPFTWNGRRVLLQIWDTAGTEQYSNIMPTTWNNAHAVLFVFAINQFASYRAITQRWIPQLMASRAPKDAPVILIANKIDLRGSVSEDKLVPGDEGRRLAERHKWAYFESSAMNQAKTDAMIAEIGRILSEKHLAPPSPSKMAPAPSPRSGIVKLSEAKEVAIKQHPSEASPAASPTPPLNDNANGCYC